MHCLDTISKLNRQAARASKPSATYRIKNLRDCYERGVEALVVTENPVGVVFKEAFTDFVKQLDRLIDRIERDEKEGS